MSDVEPSKTGLKVKICMYQAFKAATFSAENGGERRQAIELSELPFLYNLTYSCWALGSCGCARPPLMRKEGTEKCSHYLNSAAAAESEHRLIHWKRYRWVETVHTIVCHLQWMLSLKCFYSIIAILPKAILFVTCYTGIWVSRTTTNYFHEYLLCTRKRNVDTSLH